MIEGINTQEESALLERLAEIRKAGGSDGGNVKVAAEHALDRLAQNGMTGGKTRAEAYDAVLKTPQGAELYRASRGMAQVQDVEKALTSIRKIGV